MDLGQERLVPSLGMRSFPLGYRGGTYAQFLGNLHLRASLFQQSNRLQATLLELFRRSFATHT